MQMSPKCEGDFTTNPSVVAQISNRQDVCLVSLKNRTTHALSFTKVTLRQRFYSLTIIDITTKLLLKERGISPVQIGRNT